MANEIKYIEIKEFREKGYLQELNRRFLHPLGLALEIIIDEYGNEILGGIWDYRDEEEGMYYDLNNSDEKRKTLFAKKFNFIENEWSKRKPKRIEKLGFMEEPIV